MPKKGLLDSIKAELNDFKEDVGWSRDDASGEREDSPLSEVSEAAASAGRTLGALGKKFGQAVTDATEKAREKLDEMLDED